MSNPSSNDRPRRLKPAPVPVTAHRAFPAIVALWFAALLGIGSLVVPPEKLSMVVSALGIPRVIPAAAPPLGYTARALLVLLMAGTGLVAGLLIGLRIAHRRPVQVQRRTDPTRGRHDLPMHGSAPDPADHTVDSREDAEPEAVLAQSQRGPLRASEAFAGIEPLTDSRPEIAMADAEALADGHFAAFGAPSDHPIVERVDAASPLVVESIAHPGPFATVGEPEATEELAPVLAPAPTSPLAHAPLESLWTVQLVERLAFAIAASSLRAHGPEPELRATEPKAPALAATAARQEPFELESDVQQASPEARMPRIAAPAPPTVPETADRPAEALAETVARVASPRPAILDPIAAVDDDPAGVLDDEPSIAPPRFLWARAAATEPPAFAQPAATAPFGSPHAVELDAQAGVAAVNGEPEPELEPEPASEHRYPSLLDIQATPREAIRIPASTPTPEVTKPEPVVVFPGAGSRADAPFALPPASALQSRRSLSLEGPIAASGVPVGAPELPADPVDVEEADRALRAALATLQRMSGGR